MKRFFLPAICLLAASLLPCRAETIIALYSNNRLRSFESASPETFTKTVDLSGVGAGETVVAMDFDGEPELILATRDSSNRIAFYQVNPNSGIATRGLNSTTDWTGTNFGFDCLPALIGKAFVDSVLVNETDKFQHAGFHGNSVPVTARYDDTTSDGDPVDQHAGDNPALTALAFSNSFPEATSTVLYGIDATPNSLVIVNRTTGQLDTVGPLGAATGNRCGFDISGSTGTAYTALSSGDFTTLYSVDLGTGAATSVGMIGGQFAQAGVNVVDIAVLPATRLLNISTRTRVGTGEDVMIAGFTALGGAPSRLIIRGIGPSLAALGIASPLPNPLLTVFDSNGAIASNDDWKSDQQAEIVASQLAPTNDLEAAFIGNFAPGAYTAILRDANGTTGVGLIEVYKLRDQ